MRCLVRYRSLNLWNVPCYMGGLWMNRVTRNYLSLQEVLQLHYANNINGPKIKSLNILILNMVERSLTMGKFNRDEKHIHEMFSQITVDSSKLADQVKSRLYEGSADMPARRRKRWTRSTIAAIAISFALVTSATAASLGNFDWFIERFNPDFGKIVEPVGVYSE